MATNQNLFFLTPLEEKKWGKVLPNKMANMGNKQNNY